LRRKSEEKLKIAMEQMEQMRKEKMELEKEMKHSAQCDAVSSASAKTGTAQDEGASSLRAEFVDALQEELEKAKKSIEELEGQLERERQEREQSRPSQGCLAEKSIPTEASTGAELNELEYLRKQVKAEKEKSENARKQQMKALGLVVLMVGKKKLLSEMEKPHSSPTAFFQGLLSDFLKSKEKMQTNGMVHSSNPEPYSQKGQVQRSPLPNPLVGDHLSPAYHQSHQPQSGKHRLDLSRGRTTERRVTNRSRSLDRNEPGSVTRRRPGHKDRTPTSRQIKRTQSYQQHSPLRMHQYPTRR